ncbi:zf-DHHC-domain-containing protein [Phlegmacium glaucopus]|nr:zf-DHHC-domain-containing protein [Phlegmacium glaucopus]
MSSPRSFHFSGIQPISATHAGGIQPPASFFRPSKPEYHPHYSRPSTASSSNAPQHDPVSPISDDHHQNIDDGSEIEDQHQLMSLKRIKQSREPLLPVSANDIRSGGPANSKPSLLRQRSSSTSNPAKSAIRTSLDKVLSIGHGLSLDSIRRSTSTRTPPGPSPEGRPTFESKLSDDQHEGSGDAHGYPCTLPSSKHYNHSPIQHHHNFTGGQSISIRASHNSAASPSPEPSFNPTPPIRYPPLSAVPVINSKTGKQVRRYEVHPSRNRFFLGGRLLTGGDSPWAFMASFSLVLIIAGVWFGTTAIWWWKNESPAVAVIGAYLSLLTISTMLATATIDPGILPRNLDPDPPYPPTSPSDGGVRVPMPRDLKVRTDVVRVKYCPTCKTYRPPRSSHCKMCDNCVDGCDHHCQWVNNCVGRRNYTTFFALLVAATTTLILMIVTSALHLFLMTRREKIGFRRALSKGVGSAVVFCLSIAVIWPVAALLTYHMRLLLLNITTIEQIRNQAHKTLVPGPPPPNPFSHGNWRRNLLAVLCRPQGYSSLDGVGVLVEDKRGVNPGMLPGGEEEWEQRREEGGEETRERD